MIPAVQSFGEKLKAIRGEVSQDAVATETGVKQAVISKWESGAARPNLSNFIRLATGLAKLGLIRTADNLLRGIDDNYDGTLAEFLTPPSPLNANQHGTNCGGVLAFPSNPRIPDLLAAFEQLSPALQDRFVLLLRDVAAELHGGAPVVTRAVGAAELSHRRPSRRR